MHGTHSLSAGKVCAPRGAAHSALSPGRVSGRIWSSPQGHMSQSAGRPNGLFGGSRAGWPPITCHALSCCRRIVAVVGPSPWRSTNGHRHRVLRAGLRRVSRVPRRRATDRGGAAGRRGQVERGLRRNSHGRRHRLRWLHPRREALAVLRHDVRRPWLCRRQGRGNLRGVRANTAATSSRLSSPWLPKRRSTWRPGGPTEAGRVRLGRRSIAPSGRAGPPGPATELSTFNEQSAAETASEAMGFFPTLDRARAAPRWAIRHARDRRSEEVATWQPPSDISVACSSGPRNGKASSRPTSGRRPLSRWRWGFSTSSRCSGRRSWRPSSWVSTRTRRSSSRASAR